MKSISTGAGLAIVGLGIALHPVLSNVLAASPSANAASLASLVASSAATQAGPTVVWMGVTQDPGSQRWIYHRMWSDGRIEARSVRWGLFNVPGYCGYSLRPAPCAAPEDWYEVPPPPGGNGFACRADMNGDRIVNGADLGIMLNAWGEQGGCEPEATYPCLDLTNLAGGAVAAK